MKVYLDNCPVRDCRALKLRHWAKCEFCWFNRVPAWLRMAIRDARTEKLRGRGEGGYIYALNKAIALLNGRTTEAAIRDMLEIEERAS